MDRMKLLLHEVQEGLQALLSVLTVVTGLPSVSLCGIETKALTPTAPTRRWMTVREPMEMQI